MKDINEFYKDVDRLVILLLENDLKEHASEIRNAVDGGSTGTEIFMALRWHLENIVTENECNDLIRVKAKKLIGIIDSALNV